MSAIQNAQNRGLRKTAPAILMPMAEAKARALHKW